MKLILPFILAFAHFAVAAPIVVSTSAAPERYFDVALTTDKDRPEYKDLEFKEGSFPKIQIRERKTGKILKEFDFPSDTGSDEMPLRDHVFVDWSPSGDHVAITTTERHYNNLSIFSLAGTFASPESFNEVIFPELSTIIQKTIPKFKEFRSRWHSHLQGWPGRKTVMFSSGTGAITEPRADGDNGLMAVYSFVFEISDPAAPIMLSMTLVSPDDY